MYYVVFMRVPISNYVHWISTNKMQHPHNSFVVYCKLIMMTKLIVRYREQDIGKYALLALAESNLHCPQ